MQRGRKEIPIDWTRLDSYLQLRATLRQCACLLEVSEDTIERRVLKEKGMKFSEYAETKMTMVRLKLVQKAISKAMGGDNTLLIFCLKNLSGWGDVVKNENTTTIEVKQDLSGEKTDELIKKAQDLAERLENKRKQKQEPIQK
jgi:hypothetical protein